MLTLHYMLCNLIFGLLIHVSSIQFQIQEVPGDNIIGVWMNEEKNEQIEIFKSDNKYYGKLILSKSLFEKDGNTLRRDEKNPDDKAKSRTLFNAVILSHFDYEAGEWLNGELYDPRSGKTYSSFMKMRQEKLEIRSYVGISLFGRTTVWRRAH